METLRNDSQTKHELNIKEFDDILGEMLSNESMFSQLSSKIEILETLCQESISKIKVLESKVSHLTSVLESKETQEKDEIDVPESVKIEKTDVAEPPKIPTPIIELPPSIPGTIVEILLPKEKIEKSSLPMTPITSTGETPGIFISQPNKNTPSGSDFIQDKCISNIIFTHQLHPVFMDQRSPNSKGTAINKDGKWEITLSVEILKVPPKSTISGIPDGGYINYLNIQTPLNFTPKEIVEIIGDRTGILFRSEEAILGYIYYSPDASATYPHYININMILK